jgi:hypothetical protein
MFDFDENYMKQLHRLKDVDDNDKTRVQDFLKSKFTIDQLYKQVFE